MMLCTGNVFFFIYAISVIDCIWLLLPFCTTFFQVGLLHSITSFWGWSAKKLIVVLPYLDAYDFYPVHNYCCFYGLWYSWVFLKWNQILICQTVIYSIYHNVRLNTSYRIVDLICNSYFTCFLSGGHSITSFLAEVQTTNESRSGMIPSSRTVPPTLDSLELSSLVQTRGYKGLRNCRLK
jgi:hypothetical protein